MIIWISILIVGIKLCLGVVAQRVPGYPNAGQLVIYIAFPACLAAVNFMVITYSRKLSSSVLLSLFFLQLLILQTIFIISGGGV